MINKHKEGSTSSSVQEWSVMKQMNTNDTGSIKGSYSVECYDAIAT